MNSQLVEDQIRNSLGIPSRHVTTVFIISAPSGSGKSTLVSGLLASDAQLRFSVSYTTRQRRGLEKPGESYNFISRSDFEARIARGEFLEYAEVFGNFYGTHREVLKQAESEGRDLILDIDVQGARQLKRSIPEAVTIFVLAPSRDILEQRLRARSEDSEDVIQRRLKDAAIEIRNYNQYDYLLINHQVEDSVKTLASIVRAERVRRTRMEKQIQPILKSFEDPGLSLF